jgi:serine/threonine protein kinase
LQEIVQVEKLGEGDCGVIYKARWRGIDVAAKTLKGSVDYSGIDCALSEAAARADLLNEIEMLSCLRHPNVSPLLPPIS